MLEERPGATSTSQEEQSGGKGETRGKRREKGEGKAGGGRKAGLIGAFLGAADAQAAHAEKVHAHTHTQHTCSSPNVHTRTFKKSAGATSPVS